MLNEKLEELEIHPLVAAQEKSNETSVEFRGFLGTQEQNTVRLYSDFGMSTYVEIPKDAILHWEKCPGGETGKVRVFISASKEVTEIYRYRVAAKASSLSFLGKSAEVGEDWRRRREVIGQHPRVDNIWSCISGCETTFAATATGILLDEVNALKLPPERRDIVLAQIEERKQRAKSALNFCLSQCGQTFGTPPFMLVPSPSGSGFDIRPFSLGEVYSEIVRRHLEKPE